MKNFELLKQLFELRLRARVDTRCTACDVKASARGKSVLVRGFSTYRQTDTFIRQTAVEVFEPADVEFDLKVLSRDYPLSFAEVIKPSAAFYKQPLIKKEDLLTEALYGCIIRTYFRENGFVFAQHPDGYVGYVPEDDLQPADNDRYLRWKNGDCAVFRVPTPLDGVVVPPAARLIRDGNRVQLHSSSWFKVSKSAVMHTKPADSRFIDSIQSHAQVFQGTPYLWGGKTEKGIDCSGFVQSLVLQEGILLPRDANMQAMVGEMVGYLPKHEDLLPGDLLFFMNDKAHVFHVAIYVGGQRYLHSSGSRNIVISSLVPKQRDYMSRYGPTFVFARRVRQ